VLFTFQAPIASMAGVKTVAKETGAIAGGAIAGGGLYLVGAAVLMTLAGAGTAIGGLTVLSTVAAIGLGAYVYKKLGGKLFNKDSKEASKSSVNYYQKATNTTRSQVNPSKANTSNNDGARQKLIKAYYDAVSKGETEKIKALSIRLQSN